MLTRFDVFDVPFLSKEDILLYIYIYIFLRKCKHSEICCTLITIVGNIHLSNLLLYTYFYCKNIGHTYRNLLLGLMVV